MIPRGVVSRRIYRRFNGKELLLAQCMENEAAPSNYILLRPNRIARKAPAWEAWVSTEPIWGAEGDHLILVEASSEKIRKTIVSWIVSVDREGGGYWGGPGVEEFPTEEAG